MTSNFTYIQINSFFDEDLIKSLNYRFEKIYNSHLYKTNNDHIREINARSITEEKMLYDMMKKIQKKFKEMTNISDLMFNKIWLVNSFSKNINNSKLPHIPHFDKQRYLKAMVYLNDVTLECGPIYLGKVKENFKIEQKRKELPQNYKEKGLNTIAEEFLEEKLTPMVGKAGDAIFFDTNSPHKAGIIKDNYSRKVLRFDFERPSFNPRQSKLTKIMKVLFS